MFCTITSYMTTFVWGAVAGILLEALVAYLILRRKK